VPLAYIRDLVTPEEVRELIDALGAYAFIAAIRPDAWLDAEQVADYHAHPITGAAIFPVSVLSA
jgi:hypothetical protein